MKPRTTQSDTKVIRTSPTSFFKRLLFIVRVEGESAFPELIPGRYYLATNLKKPKIGAFIVFKNPLNQSQVLVKKIYATKDGGFLVRGTVSWGSSSKDFGVILPKFILGTLIRI